MTVMRPGSVTGDGGPDNIFGGGMKRRKVLTKRYR